MALLNEIRTVWSGVAGSPYYSTFRTLVGGSSTPQDAADAWEDVLIGLQNVTDNGLTAVVSDEVRVIDVTDGETQGIDVINGATVSMLDTGDPLPSLVQGLVRLNTGVFTSGRQIRGRLFIPGMTEANNTTTGVPSAGLRSGVDGLFATFLAALGTDLVIYSTAHRTYASVQSATMNQQWSFLRSRRD